MTRFEVDRACGQTPCLCGDIETWHPGCYRVYLGRPKDEIQAATERAYAIARRKLRKRAQETTRLLVGLVAAR